MFRSVVFLMFIISALTASKLLQPGVSLTGQKSNMTTNSAVQKQAAAAPKDERRILVERLGRMLDDYVDHIFLGQRKDSGALMQLNQEDFEAVFAQTTV